MRGWVERVLFHDESTGYCILRIGVEGRRDPVSLLGNAARVVAGEQFEAQGRWETNRDFGAQFRADQLKLTRPDSEEGMERYLGSGLIEGIGPAYAKRLLAKFGKRIFDVIENESAKLEEVEGVGRKRRLEIRQSWMKQKAVHNIMLFLHAHGISASRALRIYKTYGEEALSVLKTDPYRLAEDIRGIGFKTADEIARQMGLDAAAPERLRAGLLYILEQAATSGHCCLPEGAVTEDAATLLGCSTDLLFEQVAALVSEGQVQRHHVNNRTVLYLPALRKAEETIATSLRRLSTLPSRYPAIDVSARLAEVEQATGRPLADSQRHAVLEALKHRLMVITGGPGVGKTTILNTLLRLLADTGIKVVLAAPTGRAAKRLAESTGIEAKTLHRLLEHQPGGVWGRHRQRPLTGDLFVIDESSMMDAPLMSHLLAALPEEAHLLLVGDADQLPSVGPGRVLHDLIASERVPVVKLTEIFRQAASSRIITAAHAINEGVLPDLKPSRDSDFFFLEARTPEEVRDTLVQLAQTRLPAKYGFDPLQDIQVLAPMNRYLLGAQNLNQALQAALNPPGELKMEIERFGASFRAGDKVIQTQNNYDKEVFNGDMGHIVSIDLDPIKLTVRFDGSRMVEYEPGELDELQLAYALSIHKSQGSEFPCVLVPMTTQHYVLLERSLIYTAMTRAKKLLILVGDPKALSLAVSRQQSRSRWTGLRELLQN